MAIDRITTGAVLDGAIQTADIANFAVDDTKLKDNAVTAEKMAPGAAFITGMIMPYAGAIANQASAPSGWLLCDGSEQDATTYLNLKNLLQTTYGEYTNGSGGIGTTHFRLPDLRGRVIAALDNMGGGSANVIDEITNHVNATSLGGTLGDDVHLLTPAQTALVGHSHTTSVSASLEATSGGGSQSSGIDLDTSEGVNVADNTSFINVSVGVNAVTEANATTAHPNLQPTMFMNYIIKT